MTKAAKQIARLTKTHYNADVKVRKEGPVWTISFVARTTKTRASSIATRLRLMSSEVLSASHTEFDVEPRLLGESPVDRSSLSDYEIVVALQPKRPQKQQWAA